MEQNYLNLLRRVLNEGEHKMDRTGTGTMSLFGPRLEFDLTEGFPAITTKKLFFRGVVVELLWFIRGDTNIEFLHDHGVTIWNEWADENGELGPVYGKQWRSVYRDDGHVDQLSTLIDGLKNNPHSRRHLMTTWNVSELHKMALPPCHGIAIQFYVRGDQLDLSMYQRSADLFLGVPFNIASYALLNHMVAQVTGYEPGRLIMNFGDAHIYMNHLEQVTTQMFREPKKPPVLYLNPDVKNIDEFTLDDICLRGYDHHPHLKGEVSV